MSEAPCVDSTEHGRLRAQLVLTVANRETGAVASVSVVPGLVQPTRSPYGGWLLPLFPLVSELAARTGTAVASLREVDRPSRPLDADGELSPHLPRAWQPDLPEPERHALEATALAGHSHRPWRVYLGDTTDPGPPQHGRLLAQLCRAADQLCLDLVIDARPSGGALTWDIRFEVPGSPLPTTPHGYATSLPAAIEATTVGEAMFGLAERCATAPAHYLKPPAGPGRPVDEPDVDRLERRILRDCADGDGRGAQAVWRDRRWWHSGLRAVRRGWQPPSPAYLGAAIPSVICPDCRGTGTARQGTRRCFTCAGLRRLHQGVAVIVTDLADQTIWLNWRPNPGRAGDDGRGADGSGTVVAREAGGQPVVRLGERYRLGSWARLCGHGREALTEFDSGHVIDHNLDHGVVTLLEPGADPLGRYLVLAARGRPGARLLVQLTSWTETSIGQLIRLVHGLGLALRVTVKDLTANADDPSRGQGTFWQVSAVDPTDTSAPVFPPSHRSLPEAVAHCLRYLGSALHAAVPSDPGQPMRVPQQSAALTEPVDPEPSLRRLARNAPGEPITVRL
ncbi:hypothetical protein ACI2K4_13305 [Micromonospora sp. NPDC050397]|uniref:hypothetical protein n=1 Tax=Micromonospora sp. NPDC050397 TaxID=3364279 RepID=UPI00384D2A02